MQSGEFGRGCVVPTVQKALVAPAVEDNGDFATFEMPAAAVKPFATLTTPTEPRNPRMDAEVHKQPAYIHVRTKVENDQFMTQRPADIFRSTGERRVSRH